MSIYGTWILRCVTAGTLAYGCVMLSAGQELQVKTVQGVVAGKLILDGTQKAFLGLPYAAPPWGNCAGRLRSLRRRGTV